MQLSIKGKDRSLCLKEVKYSTYFFSTILLGKRMIKNISLDIEYKDNLGFSWGYCYPLLYDNGVFRDFEISIRPSIHRKRSLKIIAHELTHLYQFTRGYLKYCDKDMMTLVWHGKKMSLKNEILPWEVEAMKMEKILVEQYLDHLRDNSIEFS